MRAEEIEHVAKLHNELAYFIQKETKDDYWNFEILTTGVIGEHLKSFVNSQEGKILIAKENEKIVGFIAGEIIGCHLPISSIKKVGYISGAYVLDEYRGVGVMKNLEKLISEFFKNRGLDYVEVTFISKNLVARKCWNKLGYEVFREQARKKI